MVIKMVHISKKLVEQCIKEVRQGPTKVIVDCITKKLSEEVSRRSFSKLDRENLRKKVLKILSALEKEGIVSKGIGKITQKSRLGGSYVRSDQIWIYRKEDNGKLPPMGLQGYFKISIEDEKLVSKIAEKGLEEWYSETYETPTFLRWNIEEARKLAKGKEIVLICGLQKLDGMLVLKVKSAFLPVNPEATIDVLMPEIWFYKPVTSLWSGPGGTETESIQVVPGVGERKWSKGLHCSWEISLRASYNHPFELLRNYKRLYKSRSLLEFILNKVLVTSIRDIASRYYVGYSVEWFTILLTPIIKNEIINTVTGKQLKDALKRVLSAQYESTMFLDRILDSIIVAIKKKYVI